MDGPVNAIRSRRCRIRTLADGTQEYYDCVDDLLSPIGEPSGYPLVNLNMIGRESRQLLGDWMIILNQ